MSRRATPQIFLGHHGLTVLALSQSIDDSAWATDRAGRLYATDSSNDAVDVVTGRFAHDAMLVAVTPCNANSAPSTCPAPPAFPANYLGSEDLSTGQISPVPLSGPSPQPKGLAFING
jgi:hypothetical protein